jgi:hypothetical protein
VQDYLVGFNNGSDSLEAYNDKLKELEDDGKVRIFKEGEDNSVLYVDL